MPTAPTYSAPNFDAFRPAEFDQTRVELVLVPAVEILGSPNRTYGRWTVKPAPIAAGINTPRSYHRIYQRSTPAGSRCLSIVVIQHPSQSPSAADGPTCSALLFQRNNQPVLQSLVVPFQMIVDSEILHGRPQRSLSKQNHFLQTGFFDGPYEPLGKCIQLR